MSVTPSMIAVAMGVAAPQPGSVTERQWQQWIDDADMLIEVRRDQLKSTVSIDEARRDYVIREAVTAHVKRPDDATQVTVSVDDGSTSKSYRSGKGRVVILDEWWDLLGLVEPNGAFSLDLAPVDRFLHAPWCSLSLGATFCSCGTDIAGEPIYEVD